MQFTDEVVWSLFDSIVAGALLMGAGLVYILASRLAWAARSRLLIGFVLAALLSLAWAELAVGVFGTPLAGSQR